MAVATKVTIKCPFCRETILAGAVKCKHCHSELPKKQSRVDRLKKRLDRFRIGFVTGLALSALLAVLVYLQFGH